MMSHKERDKAIDNMIFDAIKGKYEFKFLDDCYIEVYGTVMPITVVNYVLDTYLKEINEYSHPLFAKKEAMKGLVKKIYG
jgi:hypothetical protein